MVSQKEKSMYELTKNEELILLAIFKLKDNAYGVTIRKLFREMTKRELNFGSMYNTLYLLMRRGLIAQKKSDPVARKGGKRKNMYFLTPEGLEAFKYAQEIQKLAWGDVPDLALKRDS